MNKKSIEDKFSIDIDGYFNGIENTNESKSEEYNEILKMGKALADKDFSKTSNKEAVFNKTIRNIEEHKEDNIMKKSNKIKRTAVAVATCALICGALSQTSFAKGLAEKIINTISLGSGNIKVVQVQPTEKANQAASKVVPDKLKGKVFDKNGKPITTYSDGTQFYTANGEKIVGFSSFGEDTKNSKIVTEKSRKEHILVVKDSNKLNEYTCFKVKLPSYLPKDYKFDRAELIKGKKGDVSDQYIYIFFTNEKTGKFIFMDQRVSSNETKYVTGTDGTIEKVKVNGKDAVVSDDSSIDWEADNVLYGISSKGAFSKTELIKIAESIK